MSQDLQGKIALVTGGSRGIGRAIAITLASRGAIVGVHYGRSREGAVETANAITSAGGKAFVIQADLSARGAVGKLFADFDQKLASETGQGHFDILVNNAGIAPFVGFADTSEDTLDEIFAVNVKAPFLITQEALKRLNDGGRIINFSTVVARAPMAAVAAYSALKAPIDTLTRALAVELGPREITVNAIAPGAIATDMAEFLESDEGREFAMSKQALKRIGEAADVADVAAFLAGPHSRWVTGQVIEVSGGSAISF